MQKLVMSKLPELMMVGWEFLEPSIWTDDNIIKFREVFFANSNEVSNEINFWNNSWPSGFALKLSYSGRNENLEQKWNQMKRFW
jgi:hypothetical protein